MTRLERIWARNYGNKVHFSTVKKDGFTAYVPERLALAMFLREQLALITADEVVVKTERPRPRRTKNNKRTKR